MIVYCNKCGTPIAPGSKFCKRCGSPAPAADKRCHACGAAMESGEAFCPKCGAPAAGADLPPAAECPYCGEPLDPGVLFCPFCGKKLEEDPEPEAQTGRVCPYCGTELDDTTQFCWNCGSPADGKSKKSEMYEAFAPSHGLGRFFIFTDTALIFGGTEYPYSRLAPIKLIRPPASGSDGVATTVSNGRLLTLSYKFYQDERFLKAMKFANDRIARYKGGR